MKRILNIFIKIVTFLSLLFMFATLFFSYFKSSGLVLFNSIFKYPILVYILFSVVLVFLMLCINKYIDKVNNKKLKWIKILSLILLFFGQIFIIKIFNPVQVTDSYIINDQAISIANEVEKKVNLVKKSYFSQYSNNNFVLVLSIYLTKLFKLIKLDYSFGFTLFNVLMIDLSILLLYLVGKKVKNEKFGTNLLVLSVFNPLNYLLIHWTYTVTYSLPIMLLIIYLALLLEDEYRSVSSKIVLSICFGLCVSFGYYMRPTTAIPFIAVMLCFCGYLILNKKDIRQYMLSISIILLVSISSYIGIGEFNKIYVQNRDNSWPATHWIMMGLHGDGTVNVKDNAFTRSFKTKDEMKKANIEEIKKTLKNYGLVSFTKHTLKKLAINWSDGNANYYFRHIQDKNNSSMYNWIFGSKRDFVIIYCQLFRIVTLLFVVVSIYQQLKIKKLNFQFLNILILFGGVLFYLIWEVKSSYCVPFLPFIFILSVYGIDYVNSKKLKINNKKVINIIFIITISLTIMLELLLYKPFTTKKLEIERYSVNVANPVTGVASGINSINRDRKIIKQEFRSKYSFNNICLKAVVLNDNDKINYVIKLVSDKQIIKQYNITKNNIIDENLCLELEEMLTKKNTLYYLLIEPGKLKDDSIRFRNINYKTIDVYDGDMYINNIRKNKDLIMKVYKSNKEIMMGKELYLLLSKMLLIIEFLIYLLGQRLLLEKNKNRS